MKKIIAAFDELKYNKSTAEYAISLAKQNNAFLVGIFLEDHTYHSYKIFDLIREEGGGMDTRRRHLDKKDAKIRARSVEEFEKGCRAANLQFSVHKDREIAIRELLEESIYADLLIIYSGETLTHYTEKPPTRFI